ncbi:unnamed protein product [Symbiodinium necroappetens]|uniref:Uncharacterized protein n=1 Tax=Symbiodinium necroappetens TaxID=1628268 RepID=A0A812QCM3_9DINO|nr:unnamed protein product [Symbiodinium necroappetens]
MGVEGMRSILEERSASFSSFVNADTGPVPVAGAAPLPTSLLSLASRLEDLTSSIPTLDSSLCGNGWQSKAQDVASQLDGQDMGVRSKSRFRRRTSSLLPQLR